MVKSEIVGVAGMAGAGKDTVSNSLAEGYGYLHISTGDAVRVESKRRFGTVDRRVLHDVANSLRAVQGAGALCLMAIRQYEERFSEDDMRGLVVSGIRAVGEATTLKSYGGKLLFVAAPVEVRYARLVARGRQGEIATSLEDFVAFESQEVGGTDDLASQNINAVRLHSDAIIQNDGSEDYLRSQVEEALGLFT